MGPEAKLAHRTMGLVQQLKRAWNHKNYRLMTRCVVQSVGPDFVNGLTFSRV
jgi:hypothetical protein